MRRFVLPAVAVALCLASAAQAFPLTLGAQLGSSVPDLRDDGGNELSTGYSSRFAPFAGAFAETPLSPAFSLRLELNLAPQGGKRNGLQPVQDTSQFPVAPGTSLYANFDNQARLDYLEIPLLVGWHFGAGRRFAILGGPYAGILLSAKTVTSGTSTVYTDAQGTQPLSFPPGPPYDGAPFPAVDFGATTNDKSSLKTLNWGLQLGGQMAQSMRGGDLSLSVRGGLGFTDIQRSADDGRNTTGVLVLALGYGWHTGDR